MTSTASETPIDPAQLPWVASIPVPWETDPTTIDEAIRVMDDRIEQCLETGDRGVLFAAVYRAVTARVRDGIASGLFDDCARMERFDVLFARRYLDACRGWARRAPVPRAWALAFDTDERGHGIALQHVLLGINAHINLDLGVAAAEAAPGTIQGLRADFERINDVLAELIDDMQHAISTVSPWSGLVDRIGLRIDETLVGFVLREARSQAWDFAVELSEIEPMGRGDLVERRDRAVADFGSRIADPAGPLRWAISTARIRERQDLAAVVSALQERSRSI